MWTSEQAEARRIAKEGKESVTKKEDMIENPLEVGEKGKKIE